eukprot:551605_1
MTCLQILDALIATFNVKITTSNIKTKRSTVGKIYCGYLSRITKALKYYECNGNDKFLQFCNQFNSPKIVDDYISLMNTDFSEIQQICKETCNINTMNCQMMEHGQCVIVQRHFRDRNAYDPEKHNPHFYLEMFDTIHVYLRHAKQFPFALSKHVKITNDDEKQIPSKEDQYNFNYNDRFNKFKHPNSKFNVIVTTIQQQNENETKHMLGNKIFYYWNHYQEINSNLFVSAQYTSIKEEALVSGLVAVEDWDTLVVTKANYYLETFKCKQIKCIEKYDELHYDIGFKSPLTLQHLQSVILWCDFIDYSLDFRSTFRSNTLNESLYCIKQRHKKYHYTGKYLSELVNYYGVTGNSVCGSFYCGVSMMLNIPYFATSLNGPIATSNNIEFITHFCDSNDIILELNNTRAPGIFQSFFDCKWLSQFPEENENLFMFGRYKMNILSIRVRDQKINQWMLYENRAYNLFDSMISGEWYSNHIVNKQDILLVEESIDYMLRRKSMNRNKSISDQQKYMFGNFSLYCQLKKKVILNLSEMDKGIKNTQFIGLLMNEVTQKDMEQIKPNDTVNLCKFEFFKIFPRITELIIYSSSKYFVYAFNVYYLLQMTSSSSLKRIIIKDAAKDEYKWLLKMRQDMKQTKCQIEMSRVEDEDSMIIQM